MVTRIRPLRMQPTVFAPVSTPRHYLESTCTNDEHHVEVIDTSIAYHDTEEHDEVAAH